MKTFLSYFKNYFTEDFNLKSHILIAIFIGICIFLNYHFDIYSTHFRVSNYSEIGILKLWGMYAFAFIVPILIIALFQKEKTVLNSKFLIFGLLGLLLVATDCSFYALKYLKQLIPIELDSYRFFYASLSNLASLFTIVLPLFFIYIVTKYFKPELYGLKLNGAPITPYFILILLMIPIIVMASSQSDFLNYYPSYDLQRFSGGEIPETIKIGTFELCYGFDFFSVELMFRGFMVIALSRFAGKDAILPMVVCYAFLHFGKPLGETIGSVFGGYILGIIAYKSRNIYGGLIVHLGVAWGMEITAYFAM